MMRLVLRHARAALRGRGAGLAGHALAETYAVLTRLPPHRLAPADAGALIEHSFVRGAKVAALPASGYTLLVRRLARNGMAGGAVYDAIIAETARRARATTLLTFNPRHFEPAPAGLTIVVPTRK